MPFGDGSGPAGMGPMSGRALGYCAGYPTPGYANPAPGRGFGRGFGRWYGRGFGFGRGRGWGWRWAYPAMAPGYASYMNPYVQPYEDLDAEERLNLLRGQAGALKEQLEQINKSIEELENKKKD